MALFSGCLVISVLVFSMGYTTVSSVQLFRSSGVQSKETVKVNLVSAINSERTKRSDRHLPGTLNFNFQYGGDQVSLNLQKNQNVGSDTPVFLHRDGEAVRRDSTKQTSKDVAFYQDVTKGASIMVRRPEQPNSKYELMGTYYMSDNQYSIEPVKPGKETGSGFDFVLNHTISLLNEHLNLKDDIIKFGSYEMPLDNTIERYKRQASIDSSLYTVELLMVVDNAIYKTWYNGIEEADPKRRRDKTIETIKQYYTFVLNGIDVRYASIEEPDLQIDVTFAGILIFDDSHESYLQNNSLPGDLVESSEALESFRNWVLSNMTSLPPSDHVMLFTGFNLTYGGSTSNAGLAYLKSICNHEYFFSIVEEYYEFRVISIAAHELGHSLGARHDMDENTCLSFQLYIMTSRFRFPSKSKSVNPYRFSKCSIQYFKEFIFSLESSGWTCLKKKNAVNDMREISGYLVHQPGEVFTADVQCQNSNGDASYVCRDRHNGDFTNICSQGMFCFNNELGKCSKILPADGTPCGHQKWCLNGLCVEEFSINRPADNCPFYDVPASVWSNDTCADVVMTSPWECYDRQFQLNCCDSCFYKYTNVPGCEYGDRDADCFKELCNEYNETRRLSECCETCSEVPFPTRPVRTTTTMSTPTSTTTIAPMTYPTTANSALSSPIPAKTTTPLSFGTPVTNLNQGVTPSYLGDVTTMSGSMTTQYDVRIVTSGTNPPYWNTVTQENLFARPGNNYNWLYGVPNYGQDSTWSPLIPDQTTNSYNPRGETPTQLIPPYLGPPNFSEEITKHQDDDLTRHQVPDLSFEDKFTKPTSFVRPNNPTIQSTTKQLGLTAIPQKGVTGTDTGVAGKRWPPIFNTYFNRGLQGQPFYPRDHGSSWNRVESGENGQASGGLSREDADDEPHWNQRDRFLKHLQSKIALHNRVNMFKSEEDERYLKSGLPEFLQYATIKGDKSNEGHSWEVNEFFDEKDEKSQTRVPLFSLKKSNGGTKLLDKDIVSVPMDDDTLIELVPEIEEAMTSIPEMTTPMTSDDESDGHTTEIQRESILDAPAPDWEWISPKAKAQYEKTLRRRRKKKFKPKYEKKNWKSNGAEEFESQCLSEFLLSVYNGC
ncbi:hypothetical protein LOTGIDRAFT_237696 [Lottia gigantea]|uniref:Peptidase M12B domain-containing protein n=1 Tax=Lottia gigantea TaxID=225164 RepID=V4BBG7_LOTGI|nr:hypothetical protein LOTGIDRAFT_237696 [Lottia gigantea]ESP03387.1 hypothetical protein LOTGIDRAFT_237696 [Lottia gigantea]